MNKRKLSKALGKELTYTAKLTSEKKINYGRVLLENIKLKNKLYSDHSWIYSSEELKKYEPGTLLSFKATATMYTDAYGIRKQGLKKCHNFAIFDEDHINQVEQDSIDALHKANRLR